MKAIVSTASGARVSEVPAPKPKANEILVRTHAIGINRIDLLALTAPADQIIGTEWAGDVVEVGADAKQAGGFSVGDRVMGAGPAAYAEYVVTDYGRVSPIPQQDMDWPAAASLMLALQTMHDALVTRGRLAPGDTVLMHGAASGMGLIGMQIAKALGAGKIFGTSGNTERRGRLQEFGCDIPLDPNDAEWPARVMAATGGKGVDIVVDQVSGAGFNQCMAAAAIGGRLVNVGRLGGASAAFDFNLHALRRLEYIGVTFRTRSVEEVRTLNKKMLADLKPLLAAGKLRMPIARKFAFVEAAAALDAMKTNAHFGKLVLEL